MNETSQNPFYSNDKLDKYSDEFEYSIGAIQCNSFYNSKDGYESTLISGMDLDEFKSIYKLELESEKNLSPFEDNKIIVSNRFSEKHNIKVGDNINLELNGKEREFKVAGVAYPTGPFQDVGSMNYILTPKDSLSKLFGVDGKINVTYIKMKDQEKKASIIEKVNDESDDIVLQEIFTQEELEKQTSGMTTPFMLIVVMLSFISIFIIHSSFKIITIDRLPTLGTFRSVGATRKQTCGMLIFESVFYGFIGGILGCFSGVVILYFITAMTMPAWATGMEVKISINIVYMILSFAMGVLLSIVSSLAAAIKIYRIPIKNIVFGIVTNEKDNGKWKLILGLLLAISAALCLLIQKQDMLLYLGTISMVFIMISIILLVPSIVFLFTKVFGKLYGFIFGNVSNMAIKNVRENRSILNSISLLAIGIAGIVTVNIVSYSVVEELTNFFANSTLFEVLVRDAAADAAYEKQLKDLDGVEDVYGVYYAKNIGIHDSDVKIKAIQGVDKDKFRDFWNVDILEDKNGSIKKLDDERNIIISIYLKDKLNVEKGDIIELSMSEGIRKYKVIDFLYTQNYAGSFALISDNNLVRDTGNKFYSELDIKTKKKPKDIAQTIKRKFSDRKSEVVIMEDYEKEILASNQQMYSMLKAFTGITLVIGILGIMNNLIIGFMERKKSFAVLRSVGMEKRQIIKMLFIEAFTGGLIGGTLGSIGGMILISIVPTIMKAIGNPIVIHNSIEIVAIAGLSGMVITLIATISPSRKAFNLNIIETIKCE
ncbi:putative ABC transport system permease protein [Mobilisporobacter senegalensis]|uniref:Putative ABC transport system permease protein n=1 Tax=Mobilisporobacter senegalensis TaxID=1329262 RepID=A0A3N1XGU8_9FIRM|nr:FtsX-like permease family protein [Mobilisporobacter senegalensis]ROR25875.1 putative ABC transport system permease protein [Mobilisporobacter senegalensis]